MLSNPPIQEIKTCLTSDCVTYHYGWCAAEEVWVVYSLVHRTFKDTKQPYITYYEYGLFSDIKDAIRTMLRLYDLQP